MVFSPWGAVSVFAIASLMGRAGCGQLCQHDAAAKDFLQVRWLGRYTA
jgi:hypothetical protein